MSLRDEVMPSEASSVRVSRLRLSKRTRKLNSSPREESLVVCSCKCWLTATLKRGPQELDLGPVGCVRSRRTEEGGMGDNAFTECGYPIDPFGCICLFQRLSHARLSTHSRKVKPRMAH